MKQHSKSRQEQEELERFFVHNMMLFLNIEDYGLNMGMDPPDVEIIIDNVNISFEVTGINKLQKGKPVTKVRENYVEKIAMAVASECEKKTKEKFNFFFSFMPGADINKKNYKDITKNILGLVLRRLENLQNEIWIRLPDDFDVLNQSTRENSGFYCESMQVVDFIRMYWDRRIKDLGIPLNRRVNTSNAIGWVGNVEVQTLKERIQKKEVNIELYSDRFDSNMLIIHANAMVDSGKLFLDKRDNRLNHAVKHIQENISTRFDGVFYLVYPAVLYVLKKPTGLLGL